MRELIVREVEKEVSTGLKPVRFFVGKKGEEGSVFGRYN